MKDLLEKIPGLRHRADGTSLAGYGLFLATVALALMIVIAFWRTAQY